MKRVWTGEELQKVKSDPVWVEKVVGQVGELLVGRPPQQQGVVLAELVATWLRGHSLECRGDVTKTWFALVHGLIDLEDLAYGRPGMEDVLKGLNPER